jgi:hypothetical protein
VFGQLLAHAHGLATFQVGCVLRGVAEVGLV